MTDTFGNLGQVQPSAGVLTTLYQPGVQAVISSVVICNAGPSTSRFSLSYALGAALDVTKQYLYYNTVIPPNQTFVATIGITMPKGDMLRCYSDTGLVSFNVFGDEVA